MLRSHIFGEALIHAVEHGNLELLAYLSAYRPTGYAAKGFAKVAALGRAKTGRLDVLQCLK